MLVTVKVLISQAAGRGSGMGGCLTALIDENAQ